jgi:cell fate regulator YaaT (PSP1 superfamily)
VIVESERGQRLGRVVIATTKTYALGPLRRVIRRARPDEIATQTEATRVEGEAYRFCKERLRERKLSMKLVQAEVSAGQKVTFYFASEERVDFRDLVRDLAQRFHLRIEMRQIGARDGAKTVGGIGSCGRELCCTTFLPAFQPVSIRMAKDQGMVLNPSKLAGQCGRLKCCLVYEHQTYKELGKGLPKVGKKVVTPVGPGRVLDLDILAQRVRVLLEEGGAQTFPAAEVRPLHAAGGSGSEKTPEGADAAESPESSDPELIPPLPLDPGQSAHHPSTIADEIA